MRKTPYICVTRWDIAKEDTENGVLPSDSVGTPRQIVSILIGKVLHVPSIRLVSQITYKHSASPRPTCRTVRDSSFQALLVLLFVPLPNGR